jgi:hypothetical protein
MQRRRPAPFVRRPSKPPPRTATFCAAPPFNVGGATRQRAASLLAAGEASETFALRNPDQTIEVFKLNVSPNE